MPAKAKNADGSTSEVISVQSVTVSLTDRSGAIAAAGVAQQLCPANPVRRGYRVMNLSAGDLWVNDKGGQAAASPPSFKLVSGSMYENPVGSVSGSAISIYGAAAGQAFEAAEW